MIGLGKMGANLVERLVGAGHDVVGYDLNPEAIQHAVSVGATGAETLKDLMAELDAPRAVWIMVPHGEPVDLTLEALLPAAGAGDVFIDGGNSYYKDTLRRAAQCRGAELASLVGHLLAVDLDRRCHDRDVGVLGGG